MMYALKSNAFGGIWVANDEAGIPCLTTGQLDMDCILTLEQVREAQDIHSGPGGLGRLQVFRFTQW